MSIKDHSKNSIQVLLVEDDPGHAELILHGLSNHKVKTSVKHVKDGEEALDYLLKRKQYSDNNSVVRPEIILLDLRLPKIDGLEVLEQIKTNNDLKNIPIVILTTSESDKDIAKAYHHQANNYLVKPIHYDKFAELLDDLGFYCDWIGNMTRNESTGPH